MIKFAIHVNTNKLNPGIKIIEKKCKGIFSSTGFVSPEFVDLARDYATRGVWDEKSNVYFPPGKIEMIKVTEIK